MGRKGKWFGAVKGAFIPNCCGGTHGKTNLGESKHSDPIATKEVESTAPDVAQPVPPPAIQEVKLTVTEKEDEQSKHAYSVALASAVAAEAAAVAAQAAAEVVRLTTSTSRHTGDSREEIAAIKIQTAFRGYLARRTLRTLRGLIRLRRVLDGNAVRSQTSNTLQCMQTMARVQIQIRSRRIRMTEENQALQRHLQRKHEYEFEKAKMGEEWDDSLQSKEQIEAHLLNKQEAAIRRERTLAYAFSHQWKSSSRTLTPSFTDPSNPQWGWSWLERWMAARPWENHSVREINDHASIKSTSHGGNVQTTKRRSTSRERTPSAVRRSSRPLSCQSPATPRSNSKAPSLASRKKSVSPRCGHCSGDDDSRSMFSVQSERRRRYSIAGSSVRDDESLVNSPTVPSYMASTESARARSRFHSPQSDRPGTPGSICSVKKRLSFPLADNTGLSSPASNRRHSGPPKIGIFPVKDAGSKEELVTHNSGNAQQIE
ncbi:protein IQ-DOMAIN 1-like [Canna indica]|uniref:Protein IQ-DOMAIN 1-like n=1 Tax=Canna indica TaxID=4628 RepID=A0AAQ3JUN6_9LILI|nr:protein IQ-DOMAIN 1-like [Canna indica]